MAPADRWMLSLLALSTSTSGLWPYNITMLATPTCITPQQARVLLPLLQQIASGESTVDHVEKTPPGYTAGSSCSSGSSSSSPLFYPTPTRAMATSIRQGSGYSTDESESACKYSSDELFQSKARNGKSSAAHSFCHVSHIKDVI